MRLQKMQVWWALGEAIYRVLCWMLLLLLLCLMLRSTQISISDDWTSGPLNLSPVRHAMPEEDFANLWAAGKMVRAGLLHNVYSAQLFQIWRQIHFGAGIQEEDWIYPPTVLLIGVPLSFLSVFQGFLLWDAVTLLCAVILLRHARLHWPILLAGLAGPATWRSLALGQYGVITGALVVAGLLLAPRQPIRAGIMLGVATLKPQQGVIVPVAWLAARYWRAIAAAAGMFGLMTVVVVCWLGGHAWVLFFTQSSVMARAILNAPPPRPYINTGVSVFWMSRTLGAGVAVAGVAQIAAAFVAAILVYRAWRLPDAEPLARMGATVCLSLFITPYGYTSDMVAYSIAVAVVFAANRWRLGLLDILLWTWPFFCTVVTMRSGLLLTPFFVALAAARCWRRMQVRAPAYATAAVSASAPLNGDARYLM